MGFPPFFQAWKFKRALIQREEPRRATTLSNVMFLFYLMQPKPQKERLFLILEYDYVT